MEGVRCGFYDFFVVFFVYNAKKMKEVTKIVCFETDIISHL